MLISFWPPAVELFLPHIAVAFGFAPTFSDARALAFTMNELFKPNFGPDLSVKLLESLSKVEATFDRFTDFTSSGIPQDPNTFEVFHIDNYLPEIQVALELSPTVDFAASNFGSSDIFDALYPTAIPTIKSFGSFIKKSIVSKIQDALDGLFDVTIDVPPTTGLTNDGGFLGVDGVDIGVYSEFNNRLFPPVIDIDALKVSLFIHMSNLTQV